MVAYIQHGITGSLFEQPVTLLQYLYIGFSFAEVPASGVFMLFFSISLFLGTLRDQRSIIEIT